MYRAIVVDDEPYMREGMRILIDWDACGFELIGEAENAQQAMALLESSRPDLMICDVRMPGIDGTQLALFAHARYPGMHLAFISGYQQFSYAQAAIRAQAHCYLLKPIDPDEVQEQLKAIARALDARGMGESETAEEGEGAAFLPEAAEADEPGQIISSMHRLIAQRYNKDPSLLSLSRQLHLHQGYLGQQIKRLTGKTFHQHVTALRMQKARRLLLTTGQSVKEIAHAVGISDVDYFTSQFRRETGKTPVQFRRS
jgi:YesN/AraC family two-component response regulator